MSLKLQYRQGHTCMGTALRGVLKEGEVCETLCAVYKLSTMVRTNLYNLGGGLPA